MKPKLVIRADASGRMGTGHIMRCIALAQAWQDMGGEVSLLARELPAALADRVAREGIVLIAPRLDHSDVDDTCTAAAEADWVVIDGYQFDTVFADRVSSSAKHTLFVDDLGQLDHYAASLVLNQNITADSSTYANQATHTQLLLGGRYALLRREFRCTATRRDAATPIERVLVTLGGSDPDNVTTKVIDALLLLPHIHAKVIVGAANPRREELARHCLQAGGRIELLPPVENMVPLMDEAQLAISAGGTSVLELASRGLPTLLIAIADNQLAICETMRDRGVMAYAGWHTDVSPAALALALDEFTSEAAIPQRAQFIERGLELVDGQGAIRVAREMLALTAQRLVRVRAAIMNDARRVLDWANDPVTRSVSFNQTLISWADHEPWFARRLADASCLLLIGEDLQGNTIGMVRFDVANRIATISINIAPEHRQRGLGTALILVACREAVASGAATQIRALIKPDNTASQRAFQRAGFTVADDEDVAGQRALCMVLN